VTRELRASREARENYIDTADYLFGRVPIKKLEKRLSFDDEMKKYLRIVYCMTSNSDNRSIAPSVAEQSRLADLDEED
jgi:hypothetical protein